MVTKHKHIDNLLKRIYVKHKLKGCGLNVSLEGKLEYNSNAIEIKANAIYLLRHAETKATFNNEFMSDNSDNSHISKEGIKSLIELEVDKYNFNEIIVCSNIPRILETAYIFKLVNPHYKYTYLKTIKGINNKGWEGKTIESLCGTDLNDFKEREENNNIFAKSSKGESWGQVLMNALKLINYLNKHTKDKRILLISQGSILQAMRILMKATEKPWYEYDGKKLLNLEKQRRYSYAKIECIIDKKEITL